MASDETRASRWLLVESKGMAISVGHRGVAIVLWQCKKGQASLPCCHVKTRVSARHNQTTATATDYFNSIESSRVDDTTTRNRMTTASRSIRRKRMVTFNVTGRAKRCQPCNVRGKIRNAQLSDCRGPPLPSLLACLACAAMTGKRETEPTDHRGS